MFGSTNKTVYLCTVQMKIASSETKFASKGNNFAPNKNIKLKENTSYDNN